MRSEQAVNRVEKAIEGPFRGIFWLIILLGAWMTVKDIWYSKWRLGLAYNVSSGKVFVDKAPHDCDFLAAPLGAKYCHYERHMETITEKVCQQVIPSPPPQTVVTMHPTLLLARERLLSPEKKSLPSIYRGFARKTEGAV